MTRKDDPADGTIGLIVYRGRPFLRKKELAEFLGCSVSKVTELVRGVRDQIEAGRYSGYAICGDLYSAAAFLDYNKYRGALADPALKKYVPDFAPDEIADLIGNCRRVVEA